MSAPRVGRIIGELCEVLQAAHDEGIIHRDLKPANLMVVEPDTPRERIKVMDFGLAKLVDGEIAPQGDRHERRFRRRHARLHLPGAGPRRGDGPPRRPVLRRRDDLRTADRPAAVQRADEHGHPARPRDRARRRRSPNSAWPGGCRARSSSWSSSAWRRTRTIGRRPARELAERFDTALDRAMAKLEARAAAAAAAPVKPGGGRPRHARAARRSAGRRSPAPPPTRRSSRRLPRGGRAAVPHGSVDAGADRDHEAARLRPRRRRRGGRKRAGPHQGPARRPQGAPPAAPSRGSGLGRRSACWTSNSTCTTPIPARRTGSPSTSCSARRTRGS